MSSEGVARQGTQKPRLEVVPTWRLTHADDAAAFAAGYHLAPDEWQRTVLDAWLAENGRRKWAAPRCGLAVPRQNGKNAVLEIRELFGMVALGERFLHTAHEVKTARKAFLRLASFFENEREFPELAALATSIRKTNGQEAIILSNGGSVEFVARSRGSGRGYTVDVLVLDEAQELTDEQLEALLPTISSAPLGNPQTILTGTPPPPGTQAVVFERTRSDALSGASRMAWHEWSVDDDDPDTVLDLDDQDLWYENNPALGGRLSLDVIEVERGAMSDDGFARERLGSWRRTGTASVIDPTRWERLTDASAPHLETVAFAIDVNPDRSRASVAVAGYRDDGDVQVELTDNHGGTGWVVGRMVELVERYRPCAVAVDAAGPANSLIPLLVDAGIEVAEVNGRQMSSACGGFYDDILESKLHHAGGPELATAVAAARKRPLGDAWAWHRKDLSADISPLVAVTLARDALVRHYSTSDLATPEVILL